MVFASGTRRRLGGDGGVGRGGGTAMDHVSALDSSVLVLNRFFTAVQVVSVRRAFAMLCSERAEVVHVDNGVFTSYDFESWVEISQLRDRFPDDDAGGWVRTVSFQVRVPRVIRVLIYERLPVMRVRLNRRNIFARDENRCQYCGRRFPTNELSLDHVVPVSRGGETSWENLVCSCTECNKRKGGRTPQEAHMRLIRRPVRPRRSPVLQLKLRSPKYASWRHFLSEAYWSVSLK